MGFIVSSLMFSSDRGGGVVVELRGYKGGTYFFRGGFHPMFFEGLKGIFLSFFLSHFLTSFLSPG